MKSLYIILFATFLCAMASMAKAVTPYGSLSYTAPTERIDNTPMTIDEIAGFLVYRNGVEVPAGTFEVYPLSNASTGFKIPLVVGPNDFNIVTRDMEGRESAFSMTVSLPWLASPKSVSNFTGRITAE